MSLFKRKIIAAILLIAIIIGVGSYYYYITYILPKPITITFWAFGPTSDRKAGLEAAIKLFNQKHPEITVKIQWEDWGAFEKKLIPMLMAKNPPDGIINTGGSNIAFLVAQGFVEPLDEYMKTYHYPKDRILPIF